MTFVRAIGNLGFYREAVAHKAGRVLLYVVTMMLVLATLNIMKASPQVKTLGDFLAFTADNMPPFRLEGGVLRAEGHQPHTIFAAPGLLLVIDTTGSTDEHVLDPHQQGMWIGSDKMVFKSESTSQTLRFSDFERVTLDNRTLQGMIARYRMLVAGMAAVYLILAPAFKLTGTVVLAILGLIPARIFGRNLGFAEVWKVSAYAVTGPTVLLGVASLASIAVPRAFLLYWALALVYVCLALHRMDPLDAE